MSANQDPFDQSRAQALQSKALLDITATAAAEIAMPSAVSPKLWRSVTCGAGRPRPHTDFLAQHKNKDESTIDPTGKLDMNMNDICIFANRLAALTEIQGNPIAPGADTEIRSRYGFLPEAVTIQIEHGMIVIGHPEEVHEDKVEAARLMERAARRAHQGEWDRVAGLCRRALCHQPLNQTARRELARACIKTSDAESAATTLWQTLWLDPDDAWSLVALAALSLQDHRVQQAEQLARMALEIDPSSPQALDVLGQAMLATGREADALRAFGQALLLHPQLPGPRLGAARALLVEGHAEKSIDLLTTLLALQSGAGRSTPLSARAREVYVEAQEDLMRKHIEQARETVESFRQSLEDRHGVPIRIHYSDDERRAAWAEVSWANRRAYHLVGCSGAVPEPVKLHLLAHEFMHLQMESQAREAGRFRVFGVGQENSWLDAFVGKAHDLRIRGRDARQIEHAILRAAELCGNLLCNVPVDMLVESRLREQMPVLSAAQFLSMRYFGGRLSNIDEHPELRRILPRGLLRAISALVGALSLFADDLNRGATEFAAPFRGKPSFDLSETLVAHWKSRSPHLVPVGHYALVDEFASMLGMQGMFEWRTVSSVPQNYQSMNLVKAA